MKNAMQKFFLLSFTLLFTFLLSACGQQQSNGSDSDGIQEMTIKISHVVAENTPKHQGAMAMKEYIETNSDGKIKVQVFPNSQLFGDKDEFQNLVANNVQFIIPDMTKLVANDPAFNIVAMPFLFKDDQAAIKFWDGEKGQEIMKRLEDEGAIGLKMWPNGAKHITNNVRPIEKPEDLKGLKIRSQGGKVLEKLYETLGVGVTSIPFGELYTALQQKTVDGQENTFSNIESKKFDEVQKYVTVMGHTRVDYLLMTNTKFWKGLNEETKKIIENGIKAGTEKARVSATKLNEESFNKIKERGNTEIIELTDEEIEAFKAKLKPIYDEFKDVVGEEFIEAALNS